MPDLLEGCCLNFFSINGCLNLQQMLGFKVVKKHHKDGLCSYVQVKFYLYKNFEVNSFHCSVISGWYERK